MVQASSAHCLAIGVNHKDWDARCGCEAHRLQDCTALCLYKYKCDVVNVTQRISWYQAADCLSKEPSGNTVLLLHSHGKLIRIVLPAAFGSKSVAFCKVANRCLPALTVSATRTPPCTTHDSPRIARAQPGNTVRQRLCRCSGECRGGMVVVSDKMTAVPACRPVRVRRLQQLRQAPPTTRVDAPLMALRTSASTNDRASAA